MKPEGQGGTVGEDGQLGATGLRPDSSWGAPLPERLPRPTPWPAVLAFGAAMFAWGAVTSWIVSCVGLGVSALAIGGWIQEMRKGAGHE